MVKDARDINLEGLGQKQKLLNNFFDHFISDFIKSNEKDESSLIPHWQRVSEFKAISVLTNCIENPGQEYLEHLESYLEEDLYNNHDNSLELLMYVCSEHFLKEAMNPEVDNELIDCFDGDKAEYERNIDGIAEYFRSNSLSKLGEKSKEIESEIFKTVYPVGRVVGKDKIKTMSSEVVKPTAQRLDERSEILESLKSEVSDADSKREFKMRAMRNRSR